MDRWHRHTLRTTLKASDEVKEIAKEQMRLTVTYTDTAQELLEVWQLLSTASITLATQTNTNMPSSAPREHSSCIFSKSCTISPMAIGPLSVAAQTPPNVFQHSLTT